MRIVVVGAGPAGLYAAILIKRWRPDTEVHIIERNARNITFGFGVVFSSQALDFLRNDDPETADLIEPAMMRWDDIDIVHHGETITIDGIGFSAISRLELLAILTRSAINLGVDITYEREVTDLASIDANLIIGADGLNSVVRALGDFGEKTIFLNNRFAWFATPKPFRALTQTFIATEHGRMNAHHYSYQSDRSTFIVEMPDDVYQRTGFSNLPEQDARVACEGYFADTLDGAPLIANHSVWRQFPNLSCAKWYDGNRVLVGDALHTAHFSIGSGTRLALEDVTALISSLQKHDGEVKSALLAYQANREPILRKLTRAAHTSGTWYDNFAEHMELAPWPFALSYIQRAGRLDSERLHKVAPRFAADLQARRLL